MSHNPTHLLYAKSHEWLEVHGSVAKVGISDFAQHSLGDIVFVDLPSVGQTFEKGDEFGAVESVKAASSLFIPVSGKVLAINEALINQPELINQDPYASWMIEIECTDTTEVNALLDASAYEKIAH